jgi:glycosyltransferase involved in cell wall biosynthesis
MTSCDCGRTYRNITAWPVHCPCGYKLYADDYDAVNPFYGKGKYGFIVPCFMPIGGTESWHLSLLPRLRDVSGLVVLNPSMASGPLDRLGCEVGVGIDAARKLAKASRAIVVWNIGDALGQIASRGCRVVSVSHTDSSSDWTSNLLQAQAPWTDHVVTICKDSRRIVPEGIPHSLVPNAPDPLRIVPVNKIEKPRRPLAVVIARFSKEKRLEFLADLFEEYLRDWELWIVGSGVGVGSVQIEPRHNVRVLPPTSTPGDYYAVADVVVSASMFEGYGLSSAEALLAGVPVVSTPVGLFSDKPHLATIVQHDAEPWEWAEAIRAAERKPIDDLDCVDDWVSQWQSLLDSLRPLGERKVEICRSNVCGHYDANQDACGLIAEKGRPGKVSYLLNHPATRCVDSEPRF